MAGNWVLSRGFLSPPPFVCLGGGRVQQGQGKEKYVLARNKKILVTLVFINLIWDKILEKDQYKNTYCFVAAGWVKKHSLILFVVHHPGLELHQEERKRKMLMSNFLEFLHHF